MRTLVRVFCCCCGLWRVPRGFPSTRGTQLRTPRENCCVDAVCRTSSGVATRCQRKKCHHFWLKDKGNKCRMLTSRISAAKMLALSWTPSSLHASVRSRSPWNGPQVLPQSRPHEPSQRGWGHGALSITAVVCWPATLRQCTPASCT